MNVLGDKMPRAFLAISDSSTEEASRAPGAARWVECQPWGLGPSENTSVGSRGQRLISGLRPVHIG